MYKKWTFRVWNSQFIDWCISSVNRKIEKNKSLKNYIFPQYCLLVMFINNNTLWYNHSNVHSKTSRTIPITFLLKITHFKTFQFLWTSFKRQFLAVIQRMRFSSLFISFLKKNHLQTAKTKNYSLCSCHQLTLFISIMTISQLKNYFENGGEKLQQQAEEETNRKQKATTNK